MHHIRVLRPADGVFAFFDGRVEGYRFEARPNWVDEGALALGVASYAIVDGADALVYDTHVSIEHAEYIRGFLEREGVRTFTVVLSHWHLDHIAGNAVFADSEIIASERTSELLAQLGPAIEAGELEGPPPIDPLVLPTTVFSGRRPLSAGGTRLELIHTHIHSDDATVVWMPERRLLLCGDTMEDPVTYVDEPGELRTHVANLDRLRQLEPARILPNHGDPDVIADGGFSSDLIDATVSYVQRLERCRAEPELRKLSLREFIGESLTAGSLRYYEPYEAVHRHNVEIVVAGG